MTPLSRRVFLHRSAILAAAASTGSRAVADEKPVSTKVGSASDRLRVAVVGVHGRGKDHVKGFVGNAKNAANNTVITHVCDCDSGVIGGAMKMIETDQGAAPIYVQDFRRLLDNKDIDIISVATPNHWHALMTVWAVRAGKDVYCEKPASHNVREGRLMVEAARQNNRIVQVGTQSRSTKGMREAIAHVQSGKLGPVTLSYATCYKPRKSIGKVDRPTAPPASIDYDLWSGPARLLPVGRKGLHYDWHWLYEYGNGDLGNQGVHEMDKARWGLGDPGLPASVVSVGGRFGYVDDGDTANTQLALMEYPGANLVFEVRGLDTKHYKGTLVGNIFVGDKGYVVCPSYGSGVAFAPDGRITSVFAGGGDEGHYANFVKAVRSRKVSDLNCDIEQGHRSAALCHLANISYRLGQKSMLGDKITAFAGVPEAAAAFDRMKAHLTDNKVDLASTPCLVGPKLTLDPAAEKFVGEGAAKANAMLTRAEYRKGFDINAA